MTDNGATPPELSSTELTNRLNAMGHVGRLSGETEMSHRLRLEALEETEQQKDPSPS